MDGLEFRQTWLWSHAFVNPRTDSSTGEQEYFRNQLLAMRDKAVQLVSRIAVDMAGMTVHDITHLDALWETASLVAEGALTVNPPEAFVLGASILLHDAAMSLAAYPNGLADLRETLAWKDAAARLALARAESTGKQVDPEHLTSDLINQIVPEVLRRLHAEQAESLAAQPWITKDGQQIYLIDDPELRHFYGQTIGRIAHSHWWSVQKVEDELAQDLGAMAQRTNKVVDRVKLACLLRIADALHLDSRRAPRFARALVNPVGISDLHWAFQERLAKPHVELDAIVFTAGKAFEHADAEAWWLAFDTLNAVDRELHDVDLLLRNRGREVLKARRVKGAGSPEMLARTVGTQGWRPVDARLQASDVPRIIENLGGAKLYGDDPTVALRELIQNGADAVQARRRLEERSSNWGKITVGIDNRDGDHWLTVEDNGIGMSEMVLTGPLLDFGTSFWRSPMALEEFPGLMAAGMQAIGRFGIGFFSVFMLGSKVKVFSRRSDRGKGDGRLLEFNGGTSMRPILAPADPKKLPIDGGTRVEVLLKTDPFKRGGILYPGVYGNNRLQLERLVAAVAPNLDVEIAVAGETSGSLVATPGDWLSLSQTQIVRRLNPHSTEEKAAENSFIRPLVDAAGNVLGRAFIEPDQFSWRTAGGWVTVAGLRANRLRHVQGILLGEPDTASRDAATPLADADTLARWATEQATLIAAHIRDEERQAKTAEIVLECGGEIGDLKIVKWGADWLNTSEFVDRLSSSNRLNISFSGEFSYDEETDDIHPREFRQDFSQADDAAYVLKVEGAILRGNAGSWPRPQLLSASARDSNVAELVRSLIAKVWRENAGPTSAIVVVGTVGVEEIYREIDCYDAPRLETEPEPPPFL
ncbi:ATP-binding protein [Xanthobacter sp.]|uniref:HD domain-containing protein n=1 Tax=Xanthobacter sp. TaxID=35809 RepID=UPI0025EA33F1|nr:ATP-binding protein [Xanthobacter sp.]